MNCPLLETLLDYNRGLLSDDNHAPINLHLLAGCRRCEENLHWLGEVGQLASLDRSFDIPENAVRGMVAWFKSQTAHTHHPLRKLIATLSFDSWMNRQVALVRSENAAAQQPRGRQMLFQTDGYDIDLRFEGIEDRSVEDLIGQILPNTQLHQAVSGATVQLWQNNQEKSRARADQSGVFRFAQIASGIYDLKILTAEDEINLLKVSTARAT